MPLDPEVLEALRRNSGLTLGGEGVWRYHGSKVPHPRVQKLFHEGVEVRDDGEVVLHVGRLWCYVACDSVARFVDGIAFHADSGGFSARMKHGPVVAADVPPQLAFGPDERLYVWLPGQEVACFTRGAHQEVVGHLEPTDDDRGVELVIGSHRWPLPTLDEVPHPDAGAP